MELKSYSHTWQRTEGAGINRTFMELKYTTDT